jgi:hypothetical protein
MEINRYIIWTVDFKSTNEIMDILTSYSSVIISITDMIICVETTLTQGKIRSYVGDEMEMACVEMTEPFITRLLHTKFIEEEQKNFRRFLHLTKVPKDIDECLDLINERGGIKFLQARELEVLYRLTNKE